MRIVDENISIRELKEMSQRMFGNLVKAVVDIEKGIMAVDADLHADQEALLLEKGSRQENLWGINIYPELDGEDFIEFDSMINLRPSQGNKSRRVDDEAVRERILKIISMLIDKSNGRTA